MVLPEVYVGTVTDNRRLAKQPMLDIKRLLGEN